MPQTLKRNHQIESNIIVGVLDTFFCGRSQSRREIEIVYLLQAMKLPLTWHVPFHFDGGGPNPLSSKLGALI